MRSIELHVHSFSMRHHFAMRDHYDVFTFMEQVARAGYTGVNIAVNGPNGRHLCGTEDPHVMRVGQAAAESGLAIDIEAEGTEPRRMAELIQLASLCGADALRTFTLYDPTRPDAIDRTIADLQAVAPLAEEVGIVVVIENHEDFTGRELAGIVRAVGHPNVAALFDYGNSQMVGEDPSDALAAVAPLAVRAHIKDQVMTTSPNGEVGVQGVPLGQGHLPIVAITDTLFDHGLRRFCFENVWGYHAPVRRQRHDVALLTTLEPDRYLDSGELSADAAREGERLAFDVSHAWLQDALTDAGYRLDR